MLIALRFIRTSQPWRSDAMSMRHFYGLGVESVW